ncbi:hypothetical protein K470DRAFT_163352 [Piedraia hortae CBS 480.64]|uniref:Uncharacterized protein n=1 Tax=Piedraia hortae CBS 480.64 TaxID=1314780 RepID=A0A6A7C7M0_9PEZI|nr:hypothetical protein K470DRAFT_163352 [Piedraia hortae CBS 480.64]
MKVRFPQDSCFRPANDLLTIYIQVWEVVPQNRSVMQTHTQWEKPKARFRPVKPSRIRYPSRSSTYCDFPTPYGYSKTPPTYGQGAAYVHRTKTFTHSASCRTKMRLEFPEEGGKEDNEGDHISELGRAGQDVLPDSVLAVSQTAIWNICKLLWTDQGA